MSRDFYTGKYALSKEELLSAKYYALRYNGWLAEYNSLKDSVSAVVVDDMPHGKGGTSDPTERLAARRAELRAKMELIEEAAKETNPDVARYIMIMATTKGMTFGRSITFPTRERSFTITAGSSTICCQRRYESEDKE